MAQVLSFMNINIINLHFSAVVLMGLLIGAAAGYIGSLMFGKRMSLAGGALGHLTLPGVALALLYNWDVLLGALVFLGLGIILIWLFERRSKLPLEALTAVVFASSLSVAFLFLPHEETMEALIGNIYGIPWRFIVISIILSLVIIGLTKIIYRPMVLASISEDLAWTEGVNLKWYNFVYLVGVAVAVAIGVRVVGGLMTAALLSIPAATSRNLSRSLKSYSWLAIVLGAISVAGGIVLATAFALPGGPMIIIVSALFFLLSLIFKRSGL